MAADILGVVTQPLVVVLLVAAGLLLLWAELAVFPGFGIAGVLGGVALGAGLLLALAGAGSVAAAVERAAVALGAALVLAAGAGALLLRFAPVTRLGPGLVLKDRVGAGRRPAGPSPSASPGASPGSLRGATGVALSDLRPAGFARVDGPAGAARVDVVTGGEYVAAGEPVEVVADEGYRRVVRRLNTQGAL